MGVGPITGMGAGAAVYQTQPVQQAQQAQQAQPVQQVQPVTDSKMMEQATETATAATEMPKKAASGKAQQAGEGSRQNEQEDISQEKIKKALDMINKQMSHTECQYGFHDKTNRVTIKIVDKDTDKVIKEFPPEETLEMIAKAWELAGILVDEKL